MIKKLFFKIKNEGFVKTFKRIFDRIKKYLFTKKHKIFWMLKIEPKATLSQQNSLKKKLCDFKKFIAKNRHKYAFEAFENKTALSVNDIELFNQTFKLKNINYLWHKDFLTKVQNNAWNCQFGRELKIDIGEALPEKDIKVPWEFARLQFWNKDRKFVKKTVHSFFEHNKYRGNLNWFNPMEVSIRAVNLIWLQLKFEPLKINFLANQLTQHKEFISDFLETSSAPNNHLLVDYVGLCYLNVFLNSKDLAKKTINKSLQEFEKQLLEDGCSYEGSSNYHALVFEGLIHLKILSDFLKIKNDAKSLIKKMAPLNALKHLNIGDNDSGKIFSRIKQQKTTGSHLFKDFGLFVFNNEHGDEVSLRNFNINENQPKGHFHHDNLSLTITINNKQIFVDPGTFIYTGCKKDRDDFRSIKNHSTFYCEKDLLLEQNEELFWGKFESKNNTLSFLQKNKIIIVTAINHDLAVQGITKKRSLKIELEKNTGKINKIIITDEVENKSATPTWFKWNFANHPEVKIKKPNPRSKTNQIIFKNKIVALIKTKLNTKIRKALYSKEYLHKQKTSALCAKALVKNYFKTSFCIEIKKGSLSSL